MTEPTDGWHETLSAHDPPSRPSDRSFGFSFAAIFSALGVWTFWHQGTVGAWFLGGAAALLMATLLRPGLLAPLNRAWNRVGLLLHAVMSPLVMAVLFYGVITPTGLLLRLFGHDPLQRRIDPKRKTYWIGREPREPQTRMKDQF